MVQGLCSGDREGEGTDVGSSAAAWQRLCCPFPEGHPSITPEPWKVEGNPPFCSNRNQFKVVLFGAAQLESSQPSWEAGVSPGSWVEGTDPQNLA